MNMDFDNFDVEGAEDLSSSIFEPSNEETSKPEKNQKVESVVENVEVVNTPKKRRGRPAKNHKGIIVGTDPNGNTIIKEEKPVEKAKNRNLSDLSDEELNFIVDNYSKMPIKKLATKFNITTRIIKKIINSTLETLESAAVQDPDLAKALEAKKAMFEPYVEKKVSNMDSFLNNLITKIKKN